MQFFYRKLQEMLDTPEGREWKTNFTPPDTSVLSTSEAWYSYPEELVEAEIRRMESQ